MKVLTEARWGETAGLAGRYGNISYFFIYTNVTFTKRDYA
jgi:hypothetical protein